MADFKTHVTVGAFAGFFLTIFSYVWQWTHNFAFSVLVFFTTVIGSFLPDMDSASGLPVRIIFGIYSFFVAGFVFYLTYNSNLHFAYAIAAPVGGFLLVRYALEPLFKKFTVHRGIFHSIPAFLICFFGALYVMSFMKLNTLEMFMFASALGLGYLSHLVLDEIFSASFLSTKTTHTSGGREKKEFKILDLNKAFGTALDLGLKKGGRKEGIAAWLILGLLIYLNLPLIKELIKMV